MADNSMASVLSFLPNTTYVAGKGGFVINGESVRDYSGYSVSSAGDVNALETEQPL
jgi:hypothetical protein